MPLFGPWPREKAQCVFATVIPALQVCLLLTCQCLQLTTRGICPRNPSGAFFGALITSHHMFTGMINMINQIKRETSIQGQGTDIITSPPSGGGFYYHIKLKANNLKINKQKSWDRKTVVLEAQ